MAKLPLPYLKRLKPLTAKPRAIDMQEFSGFFVKNK
jgi:hypothetical protein